MKTLILGANGMLGHMACHVLSRNHEVIGATRIPWDENALLARFLPRDRWIGGIDCFRIDTITSILRQVRPQVVCNCIGIVKQSVAARDHLMSIELNSLFPHRIALLCSLIDAKLIHISTDCVFSGRQGFYAEDDLPDPVDLYGRTKLLGEVTAHGALTLRTLIVGRELSRGKGLFEWIISRRNQRVTGYSKAIYSGLTTSALCQIIDTLLQNHISLTGIWHVASEAISKYDLIIELNKKLKLNIEIERDDRLICDRSLDGSKFSHHTGISTPAWDSMLSDFVEDIVNYE